MYSFFGLSTVIFIVILEGNHGLECQLKEESVAGTVLIDPQTGRQCNILQKRYSSFGSLQMPTSKMIIKILRGHENRISTYFDIANDEDLRFSPSNNKKMNLKIGDIIVKKVLDRESLCADIGKCCDPEPFCWFELKVLLRLPVLDMKGFSSSPPLSMNIEVMRIKLIDINDNSPQFSQMVKIIEISESVQIGMKIPLPLATDPDSRVNNILK